MTEHETQVFVAKKIWAIAALSPACGNAVMDVLGLETYEKVSKLQMEALDKEKGEVK